MNIVTLEKINKTYGDKVIFKDVTFGIDDSDKIGIVGINGAGKSTLLNLIIDKAYAESGNVILNNSLRIEHLPQKIEFDSSLNLLENVLYSSSYKKVMWEFEGEAKSLLHKTGLDDYTMSIDKLSGGELKKAAIAKIMIQPSDLLILDEPTNHLDSDTIIELEKYLNSYKGAIIMVTHDRYFLDKVTNKILEVDKGNVHIYEGNYEKYIELKMQREQMLLATEQKNMNIYRKELAWMQRGARARSTKQKAHIQRFEALRDREKIVVDGQVEMNFVNSRLGKKIIELSNVKKSFGERNLINDFTYTFLKDDRIGIVGNNGAGKSTLLKIIVGELLPDIGTVEIGTTVKIGYFSQMSEELQGNERVIDYIKEIAEYIETPDGKISATKMLERFLFTSELIYSPVCKLSGGEQRRLHMLRVLMSAPNVLILDEPSNDLDIKTLAILEDYLDSFPGVVITVSHDRYFMDRVVKRIFAFEGNEINQYEGNYSDYLERVELGLAGQNASDQDLESVIKEIELEKEARKEAKKEANMAAWKNKEKKLKFTYKEQKEYEQIDDVIAKLEADIEQCEKDMATYATDFIKLRELSELKEKLEADLEYQTERWVYLNELAEQISTQ
ncbi:MAG: ABC-F family ATP-binding cassette domain-containing protein [Lachnospiraceae bacterium]|nr:ABC-F family ATP-binding cassette domain-containing protein [Lachnospiraceae bacterium]